MWPFSSSPQDPTKDLPENLKEFYAEVDPTRKYAEQDETPKDLIVHKVLQRENHGYDAEFAKFKQHAKVKDVASINCAEIQHAVVECYRGWSLVSTQDCSEPVARSAKCMEIQQRALKQLRYENCHSKKQCMQIRGLVDYLFASNFGLQGDNVTAETNSKFESDIGHAFDRVWK